MIEWNCPNDKSSNKYHNTREIPFNLSLLLMWHHTVPRFSLTSQGLGADNSECHLSAPPSSFLPSLLPHPRLSERSELTEMSCLVSSIMQFQPLGHDVWQMTYFCPVPLSGLNFRVCVMMMMMVCSHLCIADRFFLVRRHTSVKVSLP